MTKRSPKVYLQDILDSTNYIQKFISGIDRDEFFSNVEKQDAVLRRLEIIGEAVKHLPTGMKEAYPNIP